MHLEDKCGHAMSPKSSAHRDAVPGAEPPAWTFRLYVAGLTPRYLAALNNLKQLCEQYLAGRYRIDVMDLREEPAIAVNDQVMALPTVIRTSPAPVRRVIGDLSNIGRVLQGLGIVTEHAG